MSRYLTKGVDPETDRVVNIIHGYDHRAFVPGFFVQAQALEGHPKYDSNSENYILNEGFFKGLSKKEYSSILKKWKARGNSKEVNKKYWTKPN